MTEPVEEEVRRVVTDERLSYRQRLQQLALLAEQTQPYPKLGAEAERALESGLVSDLHEGPAPYRPRYLLPDYARALRNGSEYLELEPAADLDDALTNLAILYHNVPSITGYPVYLGDLDSLLLPFVDDGWDDDRLDRSLTRFWRFLDRTIPDAFTHANVGPLDNRVARAVLRVDRQTAQVVPNLTLKWDPEVSTFELLLEAARSIAAVNKPHIANHAMISRDFPEGYGVVSCYNTLPLGGGSHTLVRLDLAESASRHGSADLESYLVETLPDHVELTLEVMRARIRFLVEEAGFYRHSYLVREGLLDPTRFTAMFGIFGLDELIGRLTGLQYGLDPAAAEAGHRVLATIDEILSASDMPYCRGGRTVLHAQSGISEDVGVTAGARVSIGNEPELIDHVLTVAPHHRRFVGGISDIFALDSSARLNPRAIADMVRGAFETGMREMTFNVSGCDLVRVTGYMVRLSDVERWKREGSRLASTVLGAESIENWHLLDRLPRVISAEFDPRLGR